MMEMSGKADTPFSLKALMKRDKRDVVYIGETDGVREVVHVYKSWSAVLREAIL